MRENDGQTIWRILSVLVRLCFIFRELSGEIRRLIEETAVPENVSFRFFNRADFAGLFILKDYHWAAFRQAKQRDWATLFPYCEDL